MLFLSFFLSQQTLRRMCYLTIKEMANISEDVIIVTSRFVPQCLMALMGLSITCVQILTSAPGSVFFVWANWKLL